MLWFIFVQVALFLCQGLDQIFAQVTLPELPVIDSSFTLSTRVTVDRSLSRLKRKNKLHFKEFYSLAQGRAKIVYTTQDNDLIEDLSLPNEGTFHVDKAGNILLASGRAHSSKGSCKLVDEDTVKRVVQTILFDETRQESITSAGLPILGPASVLFLLQRLKPQLKKVNELGLKARNVPAVLFNLVSDGAATSSKLQFFCMYAKSHLESQTAMPLRIMMSLPDGQNVLYEFLEFQKLDNSLQLVEAVESLSDSDTGVLLDPLAIQPGIGCASNLFVKPNAENNPFPNSDQTRFYFRARIAQPSGETKSVTVAYEGELDMMRVDHASASVLMNLDLGLVYHVADRQSQQDAAASSLGQILELSDSWGRPKQQQDSCVLMKIPTRSETTKLVALYHIDHLLVGTSRNNFIYLGRARVRGVWTQAYEASSFSWPVWLEQPIEYTRNWKHDDPKEQHVHGIHDHSSELVNIVIYLEEQQSQTGDGQQSPVARRAGRLLLMEIFRLQASNSSSLDRITIQMYDFNWKLAAHPPDGSSISDYFSLADRCLASTKFESNHYARADMLLASEKQYTPETLKQLQETPTTSRNLDFLKGLNEKLKLAPTIVYDLESELKVNKQHNEEESSASFLVSFRLARHRQVVSSLRYYGTGRPKKMFQFKLWRSQAGFSECSYMAAHHNQDTFFAYSWGNKLCLIDLNKRPETVDQRSRFYKPTSFDLFTNGPMDIYHVQHSPDAQLIQADPINSLKLKGAMHKFPITLQYASSNNSKSVQQFEFHVKHFNLHELNEKHSFKIDDAYSSDTNKFFDVAFVVDNSINKQVSTIGVEHEINFATCQTACLRDSSCQSFSICFVKAKYQCTLSKVNLKDSQVLLKLLDIQRYQDAKFGQTFGIHTENQGNFSVKKQRNCELHAKMYLELFHESAYSIQMPFLTTNLAHLIHQVDGRDECARICFRQTYDLLEEDVAASLKLRFDELLSADSKHNDQLKVKIETALSQHRRRLKSLCSQFLFLDDTAFTSLSIELQELIKQSASYDHNSPLDDSPANNYCFTLQPNLAAKGQESKLALSEEFRKLRFEHFAFKFELLYERQHGVKMSKSRMSTDELRAYAEVGLMQQFKSNKSMELMKNFLDGHENIQDNIVMSEWDESKCALICTQQLKGLWPACKSFDMLIIATGNRVNTMCRLNSMTLREAQAYGRNDLLEYESSLAKVQVWHYEPKLGAVEEELELESQFEITEAILEQRHLVQGATIFFIILFAMVVGLLSGIGMGVRIFKVNESVADESRDTRELVRDETFDMNTFRKT